MSVDVWVGSPMKVDPPFTRMWSDDAVDLGDANALADVTRLQFGDDVGWLDLLQSWTADPLDRARTLQIYRLSAPCLYRQERSDLKTFLRTMQGKRVQIYVC